MFSTIITLFYFKRTLFSCILTMLYYCTANFLSFDLTSFAKNASITRGLFSICFLCLKQYSPLHSFPHSRPFLFQKERERREIYIYIYYYTYNI